MYQHWDPLKVCVVGRSYPPEFYSWIKVPHVRQLFERMAEETEEDYQKIITVLERFGVRVLRPNIGEDYFDRAQKSFINPPMMPRDYYVTIGSTLYRYQTPWEIFYSRVRDASWPEYVADIDDLPKAIQNECRFVHGWDQGVFQSQDPYADIIQEFKDQGGTVKPAPTSSITGSMVSRIGRDLYFATHMYNEDQSVVKAIADREFPDRRNHVVNTGGHGDGTFCPVAPGLIISLHDVPTYAETFPGWEVVYLGHESMDRFAGWRDLRKKNHGKWWIPGFEHDQEVIDIVETWMGHWTGYVEETVFDVNMLIIDPKNVIVFNHNDKVFEALARYGITAHVVPFRHRYFWDGGIHCVTLDLAREGTMQDFFPNRSS